MTELHKVTWAISWEARKLSGALSMRERAQVSEGVARLKTLLDDLEKALDHADDDKRKRDQDHAERAADDARVRGLAMGRRRQDSLGGRHDFGCQGVDD